MNSGTNALARGASAGNIGPGTATVLEVVPNLDPRFGGLASSVPDYCQAMSIFGRYSVSLAAFCRPDEAPPAEMPFRIERFPLGRTAWLRNPSWVRSFEQHVREADTVHVHGLWTEHCLLGSGLARRARKPYVISAHGMLDAWALRQKAWKKRIYSLLFERRNLARAQCLRALTRSEAEDYRRFGSGSPIVVLPNGVNYPASPSAKTFLQRFPETAGKRLILFLSRLHRKKGLDLLCQAWPAVSRAHSDAHLVIAGPDSDDTRSRVEAMLRDLGVGNSVTMAGMLKGEMKWSALAAASIFVLPSYSEGFSIAVLEALAARRPVVITRQCNFPEIEEKGAGVQIDPDKDQLADALISLLSLPSHSIASMGQIGRALVDERFNWKVIARHASEVYDWIRGGPLPRSVEVIQ